MATKTTQIPLPSSFKAKKSDNPEKSSMMTERRKKKKYKGVSTTNVKPVPTTCAATLLALKTEWQNLDRGYRKTLNLLIEKCSEEGELLRKDKKRWNEFRSLEFWASKPPKNQNEAVRHVFKLVFGPKDGSFYSRAISAVPKSSVPISTAISRAGGLKKLADRAAKSKKSQRKDDNITSEAKDFKAASLKESGNIKTSSEARRSLVVRFCFSPLDAERFPYGNGSKIVVTGIWNAVAKQVDVKAFELD